MTSFCTFSKPHIHKNRTTKHLKPPGTNMWSKYANNMKIMHRHVTQKDTQHAKQKTLAFYADYNGITCQTQQNNTRKANVAKCQQKTCYCQTYQSLNRTLQKAHKTIGLINTFGASMRVQINFQVASNPSVNFCIKTEKPSCFQQRLKNNEKDKKNEKKRNTEYSPISLQLMKGLSTITVTVPLVLPRAPPNHSNRSTGPSHRP